MHPRPGAHEFNSIQDTSFIYKTKSPATGASRAVITPYGDAVDGLKAHAVMATAGFEKALTKTAENATLPSAETSAFGQDILEAYAHSGWCWQ